MPPKPSREPPSSRPTSQKGSSAPATGSSSAGNSSKKKNPLDSSKVKPDSSKPKPLDHSEKNQSSRGYFGLILGFLLLLFFLSLILDHPNSLQTSSSIPIFLNVPSKSFFDGAFVVSPCLPASVFDSDWWVSRATLRLQSIIGFVFRAGAGLYSQIFILPSSSSEFETLYLKNTNRTISINFDSYGVPHVEAQNLNDAIFAQGFLAARDRLWQLELSRRTASGRLSEIFGSRTLYTDRLSKTLGFYHLSLGDVKTAKHFERQLISDYANGINHYLRSKSFRKPLEYDLIGLEYREGVDDWSSRDIFSIIRLMSFTLSKGMSRELTKYLLESKLGVEATELLEPYHYPSIPFHAPYFKIPTPPSTTPQKKKEATQTPKENVVESVLNWKEQDQSSFSDKIFEPMGGSNCIAIASWLSETGSPVLACDPHLPLRSPSFFYEIHIRTPEHNIRGLSTLGVPGLSIGHNNDVAVGVTLGNVDADDLFIEQFETPPHQNANSVDPEAFDPPVYLHNKQRKYADQRVEKIRVKGEGERGFAEVNEVVVSTVHGPIISHLFNIGSASKTESKNKVHLSLCSLALMQNQSFAGGLRIILSTNWTSFKSAVSDVQSPSLNLNYIDRHGNIGYYLAGNIPLRHGDGSLPLPGTGEYDWKGFVPFEEKPHAFNPESGFIISANQKIVGEDYKYHQQMGNTWTQGFRAQRLAQLVEEKKKNVENKKIKREELKAMEMDVVSLAAKELVSIVTNESLVQWSKEDKQKESYKFVMKSLQQLREEHYSLDIHSKPAVVYQILRKQTMKVLLSVIEDEEVRDLAVGRGLHPVFRAGNQYIGFDTTSLFKILRQPNNFWLKRFDGSGSRFLLQVFDDTLAYMKLFSLVVQQKDDVDRSTSSTQYEVVVSWGQLHKNQFKHSLGLTWILGSIFDVGPFGLPGDIDTPFLSPVNARISSLEATDSLDPSTSNFSISPSISAELVDLHFSAAGFCPSARIIVDFPSSSSSSSSASSTSSSKKITNVRSEFVIGPGNSGQIGSVFYDNQYVDWYYGQYHPGYSQISEAFPVSASILLK